MKTALNNTSWLNRIGFYLLSLVVLALAGWSSGAVMLAGLIGGIALLVWWVMGLGWASVPPEELDLIGASEDMYTDPAFSFLDGNVYHSDD